MKSEIIIIKLYFMTIFRLHAIYFVDRTPQ